MVASATPDGGGDWSTSLGCIADDLTGATDLANALARAGVPTSLFFGLPLDLDGGLPEAPGAVVVALPVRSTSPDEACAAVRSAVEALQGRGVRRFYSKYGSTFDSTPAGNIGPIADELMSLLGVDQLVHAPTYPENERTVYQGHLFVGSQLLGESSLREHPVNPMTDSNLVRWLQRQTPAPVGLLPWPQVAAGRAPDYLDGLRGSGVAHVIADALTASDLDAVAAALSGRLAGGGAAFGAAVARALAAPAEHENVVRAAPQRMPAIGGRSAVVVGSASRATRRQVRSFQGPVAYVTAADLAAGENAVDEIADWAERRLDDGPVLVAAAPLTEREDRQAPGRRPAAAAMEQALARVAVRLVSLGVDRLLVAGGETSGAAASALGLRRVEIGPEICPGVPWCYARDGELAVAFKSGNFGPPSFFADAFKILEGVTAHGG